jgi:lipoprotein-anchoring transpeptidase ErfK/SrfK
MHVAHHRTLRIVAVALTIALAATALAGCSDESAESETQDEAAALTFSQDEIYYAVDQLDDEGRRILSPQDVGPVVAQMQQNFADADLPVEVTGVYDDDTLALVLAFQYSQGLVPDGVVGYHTWEAAENPVRLPEDLDRLEIVEIAQVALTSPSDAEAMIRAWEEETGFKPPDSNATDTGPDSTDGEDAEESAPAVGTPGVYAIVRLGDQHAQLYDENDNLLHDFPISSGADGLTPVGEFVVQSRDEQAWAPGGETTMAWMTRFNGGIGFHGIPVKNGEALDTPLGERPVSHGCVRMEDADAKTVYETLPDGAAVIVRQ